MWSYSLTGSSSDDGITSFITITSLPPIFIHCKSSIRVNSFWSYFAVWSCLVSFIENFGESGQATAFTEEGFAISKIFAISLEHTMVCPHVSMERLVPGCGVGTFGASERLTCQQPSRRQPPLITPSECVLITRGHILTTGFSTSLLKQGFPRKPSSLLDSK